MLQLQLNLNFSTYCTLVSSFENILVKYKEDFQKANITISHPSNMYILNQEELEKFTQLYPKEIEIFGNISKFYIGLHLLNYHLGNVLNLTNEFSHSSLQNEMTFSIYIEDLLVIKAFKYLL